VSGLPANFEEPVSMNDIAHVGCDNWARRCVPLARALRTLAAALLTAVLCAPIVAREAQEVGEDPKIERHMMELASELRCLQCQNQTLADSNAPLAVDLRQEIRELLVQGKNDEQVKQYLVARYGDFVLYRPPVQGNTFLLWFGPAVVLVAGLTALYLTIQRRLARIEREQAAAPLSDAEARRAQDLLDHEDDEGGMS
jgi:cytochrome c-type biogenesis protein CcmH